VPFSSRSTRSSRVPRLVPRFLLSTRIVPFTFPPHLHPLVPCTLLPPCIDVKPSCVIYAHASPVLCALTVLRHVACRALLGSCVGVSCHNRLTYRIPCRSFCFVPFGLPSHSTSSIASLSLITLLPAYKHHLARSPRTPPCWCRTPTLSATSLFSPSHLCTKLRIMSLFATRPSTNHTALRVAP
jgi:hypothetical protein